MNEWNQTGLQFHVRFNLMQKKLFINTEFNSFLVDWFYLQRKEEKKRFTKLKIGVWCNHAQCSR